MRAQLLGKGDGFLGRSFTAGLPRRRLLPLPGEGRRAVLVSRYGHNALAKRCWRTRSGMVARLSRCPRRCVKELAITDTELSAAQFMMSCQATLFQPFIFQAKPTPTARRSTRSSTAPCGCSSRAYRI